MSILGKYLFKDSIQKARPEAGGNELEFSRKITEAFIPGAE